MDSVNSTLRIFEIPETLDWRSLLRPLGQDFGNFLDASEAEDAESWSETEIHGAMEVLNQSNFKTLGDCLNVLSPGLFNVVFNLNRCYANLEKQNQILLCQFLGSLCSKVQVILEAIPPRPYVTDKEASRNVTYKEFVDRIASMSTSEADDSNLDGDLTSPPMEDVNELTVGPRSLGLVLRSLVSVSVFLVSMCYKFVTTFEKTEGNTTFEVTREKGKRGRKGSRKDESASKVNTMAIGTLVEALITCCKYNLKYPYASEYGGSGRPSVPMLRMLFQTLLQTLALEDSVCSVSKAMIQSIAKVIKINFNTMQSGKMSHDAFKPSPEANAERPGEGASDPSQASAADYQKEDLGRPVDDLEVEKIMGTEYDDEWLYMLIDEMKKTHCHHIVDVLDLIKDSNIPNIIVNELFINIKENYASQVSSTNQLVSSLVQNEFTNIGLFFEKMAKKVPCVVLSNIDQLKQLFDVPCYALRKSIMESIKLLILLSKYYDDSAASEAITDLDAENHSELNDLESPIRPRDDDDYKLKISRLCSRSRQMLLDLIISRQFDSYMYARACVLKVLHDLIEADALPVRKYTLVVSFATARLMDRGSQVRQRALSLVSLIVDVVTKVKFMLPLDTEKLSYELGIVENNIKKVNYLQSQQTIRKCNINSPDEPAAPNSPTEGESGQGSTEFVDALEYDYDVVLLELKCDFGEDILDKLDELFSKLELAKELYTDAMEIAERVDVCLELSKKLLRSPTETDQRAAIKFVCSCHMLGLQRASQMLPLVWALAWSNNQNVVESVMQEFKNVYFQNLQSGGVQQTCNLLIELINKSDLTSLASVEKIFQINQNKQQLLGIDLNGLIDPVIKIATTQSLDSGKNEGAIKGDSGANKDLVMCKTALNLIKIILSSSVSAFGQGDVKDIGGGEGPKDGPKELEWDMGIFKTMLAKYREDIMLEVCQILIYVETSPALQEFVRHVLKLFLEYFGTLNYNWFQLAQIAVDLTFVHLNNPLTLWSGLIKDFLTQLISDRGSSARTEGTPRSDARKLSHLIFMAGHVSIRSMIFIEKVQNDLKAARAQKNEDELENNMGLATKDEKEREFFDGIVETKLVNDNLLGGPMFNIVTRAVLGPQEFIHPNEELEFIDFFRGLDPQHFKRARYSGPDESFNSVDRFSASAQRDEWEVLEVDSADRAFHSCAECNILFMCGVISLCKFATVSKKFCNLKLQNDKSVVELIISLLVYKNREPVVSAGKQREVDEVGALGNDVASADEPSADKTSSSPEGDILNILKCNLLICYGDLLVRHPNIMEPMNEAVFRLLSNPVDEVRETAILVFSHLVMNDMIKPKGRLLDNVMFLTQDANAKIGNYARVFLNEIHRKNPNTIYNCFPEMLSTLSHPSLIYRGIALDVGPEIQENDDLRGIRINLKILNDIFQFVKNDKQEHLVEKICVRLSKCKTIFSTAIYINALLLINYDEKNVVRLSKSLNLLRQMLSESQPLLAALCIIHKRIRSSKAPKVQGQVDPKEVAEEIMTKVKNILGQGKATMLIRASQFSEQIIELLNTGNYTSANLKELFERSSRDNTQPLVKREPDEESSNAGDDSASAGDEFYNDLFPNSQGVTNLNANGSASNEGAASLANGGGVEGEVSQMEAEFSDGPDEENLGKSSQGARGRRGRRKNAPAKKEKEAGAKGKGKKRGRGRQKVVIESDDDDDLDDFVVEDSEDEDDRDFADEREEEEEPKKVNRGRGRRRKLNSEEDD